MAGTGTSFSDFITHAEEVAKEIGVDALLLLKATVKLIEVAAPVAAIVGSATGNPEVAAAATVAGGAAKAADQVITAEESAGK